MSTIGEAYLQIKPSMEGVKGELESAMGAAGSSGAASYGASFNKGLKAMAGVSAVAVGALVGETISATASVAEYGDNIDKMSQKIGISAQAYQEWDAVMQHCGASIDSLQPAMKTLATQAQSGNEAFQQLGISEEEVANLSQEDLFAKVVEGLQGMEEGTERTYIASQLLGRGATELGALFNTSAEDTQAMIDTVHELGGVMSDDAVKAAAGFQDSLQDMQTAMQGMTRGAMSEFLPSITSVMNGITQIFSGNTDLGLQNIQAGIDSFIASLNETLPQLIEVGMGIIKALATAIIENLPQLAEAAIQILMDLVGYLIENLPMIIDVGLDLILALVDGLIAALPELIPAIVNVVLTIVDKLTQPDTIVQLIEAAITLIGAIAIGIIKAIPQIIAKVPEIIMNIITVITGLSPDMIQAGLDTLLSFISGIIDNIKKVIETGKEIFNSVKDGISEKIETAKNWGKDLIDNFVQGIKDKIQAVKDTVGAVAQTVKDILGFSEPEEGPLSNFHTFAPDMMNLFATGIKQNLSLITDAMNDVTGTIASDFTNAEIAPSRYSSVADPNEALYGLMGSNLAAEGGNITIPVYIGQEKIDTIVINAQQRHALVSGGR